MISFIFVIITYECAIFCLARALITQKVTYVREILHTLVLYTFQEEKYKTQTENRTKNFNFHRQ